MQFLFFKKHQLKEGQKKKFIASDTFLFLFFYFVFYFYFIFLKRQKLEKKGSLSSSSILNLLLFIFLQPSGVTTLRTPPRLARLRDVLHTTITGATPLPVAEPKF
jgi:hypothetical protein